MTPTETGTRPRVEGEREQEILEATLEVLAEVGYDRLTMDAVAARAKASKATLYRRWNGKPELVVGRVMAHKGDGRVPDTGTLRGDLLAAYCGARRPQRPAGPSVLSAVVTAMGRDPEFAEVYRRDFIGPKVASSRAIFERARARGEVAPRRRPRPSSPRPWPGSSCTASSCSARQSPPSSSAACSTRSSCPPRCTARAARPATADPLSDPSDPLVPTAPEGTP